MKSKTLLFNKGLFSQHIRSVLWVSVFFLLAQIVLLPLGMLTALKNEGLVSSLIEQNPRNMLLEINYSIQYFACLIFSVLAGIVLTRYISSKRAADFMHGLPFKRNTLLIHVYITGVVSLLLPILINALILLFMRPFVQPIVYTAGNLAEWAGVCALAALLLFTVTILMSMLIGPAILQVIAVYGIFFLPAGLAALVLLNARQFVNGLAVDSYTRSLVDDGIFLIRADRYQTNPFTATEWATYSGLAVLSVLFSFYLYKKRPAEAVHDTIAFPLFKWLFILVMTFAATLLGGSYFALFLNAAPSWIIAGYVMGALAGYALLQMIVQKSLRLVWPWKGFVLYTALIAVLLVPGSFFAAAYEQEVPLEASIEQVYLGEMPEPFSHYFYDEAQKAAFMQEDTGFMKNRLSIEQVIAVHKQLIKFTKPADQINNQNITIIYKKKDGSSIQRQYTVPAENLAAITSQLRANKEFIEASHPVLALMNEKKMYSVELYDSTAGSQMTNTGDPEVIKAVYEAIKQDALAKEAAFLSGNYGSSAGMANFFGEQHINISSDIRLSDARTIQAIREFVPGGERFASPEQVEKAFVVQAASNEEKKKLQQFLWETAEGKEPDWALLPFAHRRVTDSAQLARFMEPERLENDFQHTDQFLILKWKSPGYAHITMSGMKADDLSQAKPR